MRPVPALVLARMGSPESSRKTKAERPDDPRPTGLDLFSGAGGMSLGFEQAGFDVLSSVEYDPVHAAVHQFNFPLTEVVCANIASVSTGMLGEAVSRGWARHSRPGRWSGDLDVVFGGPPCQGFSSIGKRLIDDRRNQLVFHFFRIVSELQPRYFVMENVPGMARGGHASILEKLIAEFRQSGYQVVEPARILNAADYGVPQDRRRLFLLGAREDQAIPSYPAPTVGPVHRHGRATKDDALFEALPPGPMVWDAIGDLPDLDRFPELLKSDAVCLTDSIVAGMESATADYAMTLRHFERSNFSHRREWRPNVLTSSTRTTHTEESIRRFRATNQGETEPISRFYRLHPDGLCNTLRAGTGSERGAFTSPRPIHPTLPRVISVREAARLHSFPDWFRLHATKWHGFRQIGNAVAPPVARAVAAELARAMGVIPWIPSRTVSLADPKLLSFRMQEAADHFGADSHEIPAQRTRRIDGRSERIAA